MNNYYISSTRGSDSTGNGSATNPWKTIGKAIGQGTASIVLPVDGARVWIEPGVYYEAVTVENNLPASPPLDLIGDCDGAGFLAGGWSSPRTGVVEWAAWSNPTTPLSGACLLSNGKRNATISRIKFRGGANTGVSCVFLLNCDGWSIRDSTFVAARSAYAAWFSMSAMNSAGATVERCRFINASGASIRIVAPLGSTEYALATSIRCCYSSGSPIVELTTSGSGTGMMTGLTIEHCTVISGSKSGAVIYAGTPTTMTTPNQVKNCVFMSSKGVESGHATQIAEDWNVFDCTTPRVNAAAGANSTTSLLPALDFDDGLLDGTPIRPWGTPTGWSPIGGYLNLGTPPSTDLAGRNRPEGLQSSNPTAGALERHDTGEIDATYMDAGSPACLKLIGPASLERPILLDQGTTTISVKTRWDGNHGDANKPQAILLANPEIGVTATQTLTATSTGGSGATPNAYETLTFTPVTPLTAGALMLRLVSRAASGNGAAYFDSIDLA